MRCVLSFVVLICLLSCADSPSLESASPQAEYPQAARDWRLRSYGTSGELPPDALLKANQSRLENLAFWKRRGREKVAGIERGAWVSRGPQNVGGRTRSLLIHPDNPNEILAGSVSGGIWKSQDAGESWEPIDDFFPNLAIGTMVRDPFDPDSILVGTGDGFGTGHAIRGAGVFRSRDSGVTWEVLPETTGWRAVNRLAAAPTEPGLFLAGVGSFPRIYRSTDGGESWVQADVPTAISRVYQVLFHPTDSNQALATHNPGVILRSVDGGVSWLHVTTIENTDRIELAYAPSDPSRVYAVANLLSGIEGADVWVSDDGGMTFRFQTRIVDGNQWWFYNSVFVAPTDRDFVVVGGRRLWRSTNGAVSFENAPIGGSVRVTNGVIEAFGHVDYHALVPDPGFEGGANSRVWVGNDGGVFETDNIFTASSNEGWENKNLSYQTTQFYGACGDAGTGVFLGGTQDNGTLRTTTRSTTATRSLGGDGGYCLVDPVDPNIVYGESQRLGVARSTDGGRRFFPIDQTIPDEFHPFIALLELDPNNRDRLYAGGVFNFWKTENARTGDPPLWERIETPGDRVLVFGVAPTDSNVLWAGEALNQLYLTRNGLDQNRVWQQVETTGIVGGDILDIAISRFDSETVYLGLGHFSENPLWKTTDGGESWVNLRGTEPMNLPQAPLRSIVEHPTKPNWLYVGTEVGIYASEDGGATWSAMGEGPASVSTDHLSFLHNSTTLLAATHGRGLWSVDVEGDGGATGTCIEGPEAMCLSDERFRVTVDWTDFDGNSGAGTVASDGSADTGIFWFFSEENWELMVKVLSGCEINDRFWVFAAATTNVGYTITVTDTQAGALKRYTNELGEASVAVTDTEAFSTCGA